MIWRRSAAVLPGIGIALMPKLICPLCWPAYAGLLSAAGLGFLINSTNLLIVTASFLIVAASVRNSWPVRLAASCPQCISEAPEL